MKKIIVVFSEDVDGSLHMKGAYVDGKLVNKDPILSGAELLKITAKHKVGSKNIEYREIDQNWLEKKGCLPNDIKKVRFFE